MGTMAVPIATAAKVVTSGGFKRCAMSFRVAGVGLCDIPTCFIACRKSFCVAAVILLRGFQKRTLRFRARHSTLETSMFILRGMRSTLDMSCCMFFANRIVRAASSGDSVHIAVLFCMAGAAFGEDPLCVECHFGWQVQYLGHFSVCNCRFPHWHGCARCDVAFIFRAILPGRQSTW